jgi:Spy/CpxP family protein refolding chaperone
MKKQLTIVLSLAAVLLASTSFAQQSGTKSSTKSGQSGQMRAGGPGGRPGGMMRGNQQLMAQLNLTADQQKKVKALNDKTQAEFRKLRESNASREQTRPKMMALFQKQQEGLKKILTAAQWKKFETLREAEMKKMRQGGQRGRPSGPGGPPPRG